jgi:small nuclear ribonucleoprotein G
MTTSGVPKGGPGPELKKFLDKRVDISLNGKRRVIGTLRGSDLFMNLTLDDAVQVVSPNEQVPLGTVVIRGNAVETWICVDKVRT